jgi:hypothetical protein
MILLITSCESEISCYKPSIMIKHVREKTELSFESVCRKSYYKIAVIRRDDQNSMQSKKSRKSVLWGCIRQLIDDDNNNNNNNNPFCDVCGTCHLFKLILL